MEEVHTRLIAAMHAAHGRHIQSFIYSQSSRMLDTETVAEAYNETIVRVMTAIQDCRVQLEPCDILKYTFVTARNVACEFRRTAIKQARIYHPDGDPDSVSDLFGACKQHEIDDNFTKILIEEAFLNCGLSEIENTVLRVYAENIERFNDRDIYIPLTELLKQKLEGPLPRSINTQRRLKSVFLSAKLKLMNHLKPITRH
jgi:DNA-directed RNA polymerase specialized sigma24 family protein